MTRCSLELCKTDLILNWSRTGSIIGKDSGGKTHPGESALGSELQHGHILSRHISSLSAADLKVMAAGLGIKNTKWTEFLTGAVPIAGRAAFLKIRGAGPKTVRALEERGVVFGEGEVLCQDSSSSLRSHGNNSVSDTDHDMGEMDVPCTEMSRDESLLRSWKRLQPPPDTSLTILQDSQLVDALESAPTTSGIDSSSVKILSESPPLEVTRQACVFIKDRSAGWVFFSADGTLILRHKVPDDANVFEHPIIASLLGEVVRRHHKALDSWAMTSETEMEVKLIVGVPGSDSY